MTEKTQRAEKLTAEQLRENFENAPRPYELLVYLQEFAHAVHYDCPDNAHAASKAHELVGNIASFLQLPLLDSMIAEWEEMGL